VSAEDASGTIRGSERALQATGGIGPAARHKFTDGRPQYSTTETKWGLAMSQSVPWYPLRRLWPLALLATMGLCGCSPSVPDTLKISMLVPQTGPFELRGKDLINGAQLAVDEIDASGYKIRGKPVKFELVTVDDKGEVDAATQGAQKLVADGVLAAIGPLNTPQAAPVVPIFASPLARSRAWSMAMWCGRINGQASERRSCFATSMPATCWHCRRAPSAAIRAMCPTTFLHCCRRTAAW